MTRRLGVGLSLLRVVILLEPTLGCLDIERTIITLLLALVPTTDLQGRLHLGHSSCLLLLLFLYFFY